MKNLQFAIYDGRLTARDTTRIFHTFSSLTSRFSLTPCFSWVGIQRTEVGTVSTVSTVCDKPLKRFFFSRRFHTQLKQGVNEGDFDPQSRDYESGLRGFGGGSRTGLHAQRTDQIHIEDLDSRIGQRDHNRVLIWSQENLFGMIHINRFAVSVDGKSPKRRVLQSGFKINRFHISRLPQGNCRETFASKRK